MRNTLLLMGLLLSCLFTANSYAQEPTTVTLNAGTKYFSYTETATLTSKVTSTITVPITLTSYASTVNMSNVVSVSYIDKITVSESYSTYDKKSYTLATLFVALKVSEQTTIILQGYNYIILNVDDIEFIYPEGLSLQYTPKKYLLIRFIDNDLMRSILPIININDGHSLIGFTNYSIEFYAHLFGDFGGGHNDEGNDFGGGVFLYAPLHPSNYAWYKPKQAHKFYVLNDGFYYWNGSEWRGY